MRAVAFTLAAVLAAGGVARAEVVESGTQGFRLKTVQQVAAPPAKVYAALGEIGHWWNDTHTYSGKAANLSAPLQAGACFCEALANGGGVRHGVVEAVIPGRMVRFDAALGPLQDEGVSTALTFILKPTPAGTELTVTYNVGGAGPGALALTKAVDGVIVDQATRLKRYAETGRPD